MLLYEFNGLLETRMKGANHRNFVAKPWVFRRLPEQHQGSGRTPVFLCYLPDATEVFSRVACSDASELTARVVESSGSGPRMAV